MYKYSFIYGRLYFQGLVDFYCIKNPTCICVDECLYFDWEVYYSDGKRVFLIKMWNGSLRAI